VNSEEGKAKNVLKTLASIAAIIAIPLAVFLVMFQDPIRDFGNRLLTGNDEVVYTMQEYTPVREEVNNEAESGGIILPISVSFLAVAAGFFIGGVMLMVFVLKGDSEMVTFFGAIAGFWTAISFYALGVFYGIAMRSWGFSISCMFIGFGLFKIGDGIGCGGIEGTRRIHVGLIISFFTSVWFGVLIIIQYGQDVVMLGIAIVFLSRVVVLFGSGNTKSIPYIAGNVATAIGLSILTSRFVILSGIF